MATNLITPVSRSICSSCATRLGLYSKWQASNFGSFPFLGIDPSDSPSCQTCCRNDSRLQEVTAPAEKFTPRSEVVELN